VGRPEVATGTHIDPKLSRARVADIHRSWAGARGHIAKKTAAARTTAWATHVQPRWGRTTVAEVKTGAVRSWVAKMVSAGIGTPAIENAFHVLRGVLSAAVEEARIPRNRCAGVKLPKRQHTDRGYLTHGQVMALAAECGQAGVVVQFLAYTGLRWGRWQPFGYRISTCSSDGYPSADRSRTSTDWTEDPEDPGRSVPFPAVLAGDLAALMTGEDRDELVFTNQ
jgi:hypothetical protein